MIQIKFRFDLNHCLFFHMSCISCCKSISSGGCKNPPVAILPTNRSKIISSQVWVSKFFLATMNNWIVYLEPTVAEDVNKKKKKLLKYHFFQSHNHSFLSPLLCFEFLLEVLMQDSWW